MDKEGVYPKYLVYRHPDFMPAYNECYVQEFSEDFSPRISMELVDDFCFVLRPIKDKHARVAMAAYAESVIEENSLLAKELRDILSDFY